MKEVEFRYGFPLFTTARSTVNLLKLERNRVSDIWSFWDYLIKQHLKRNGKTMGTFLSSLHEQSMYFYKAAEQAPIRSQPLLYYYSFLNLAKIFLCLTEGLDSTKVYQHGIRTTVDVLTTLDTATVEIQSLHSSPSISVAHRLMTLFDDRVMPAAPTTFSIKECLEACVGIHRTYCETYGGEESFVRLESPICYQHGIAFGLKSKLKRCTTKKMTDLTARGYNVRKEGDAFLIDEFINLPDYNLRKQSWIDLSVHLKGKGVWSYTDGNEYRMYVASSNKVRMSPPTIIYAIMFFLGSVTRYNPYFFDTLMDEKEQWLISEFLNTQPKQFLYYMASAVVGKPVYQSRTSHL